MSTDQPPTIRIQITETRDDGETVFRDEEMTLGDRHGPLALSQVLPAVAASFRWTPGDFDFDFHPAPRHRLVLVTSGALEITVSTGETRMFRVGDILSIRDTWGRGHRSRAVDGPFTSAFIALDDSVLLDRRAGLDPAQAGDGVPFLHNQEDAAGVSYPQHKHLPFVHGGPEGLVTGDIPITGFQYVWASGDLDFGWHPAPQRQIVLVLTGGLSVTYGNGDTADRGPGEFLVGEDTDGRGHITRARDGAARLSVFAHLAPQARF